MHNPKDICFAKGEGKPSKIPLLSFLTDILMVDPQGKMYAKFSKVNTAGHASLALINCKERSDESLTAFIYAWVELLR